MEKMSYRHILSEELDYRLSDNPSYSLRAFARDLDVRPSQLSDILKGKSGLSSKKSVLVAEAIGLNVKEQEIFKAMVEVEHGRSEHIKMTAKKFIEQNSYSENFESLTLDGFKIISDWYHFAILSTMELDDYDGSLDFIATNLMLDLSIVEQAAKRLLRLDYIDLKNGKFVVADVMLATTHDIESSALRKFHKQHLNKSIKAVDEINILLRDITTMTMAIDLDRIKEAKSMITKFRRGFCKKMESGKKNHVYNLNIQFIPLSKISNEDHL